MNTDLSFLNEYHNKLKTIANNIVENLPILDNKQIVKKHKEYNFLCTIQYKDLTDWKPKISDKRISRNLEQLADKLRHMIYTGKADSIKPMLIAITNNNVKTLYKKGKGNQPTISNNNFDEVKRTSLGKGHFRWNESAITLTNEEINHVKKFFDL